MNAVAFSSQEAVAHCSVTLSGFEVPVEILVGIGVRRIGRQKDELDPVLPVGKPLLDLFRVMHAQVIDDEDDFPLGTLHQQGEELDASLGIDTSIGPPVSFHLLAYNLVSRKA